MIPKSIRDLAQLSDPEFFQQIAEGMHLVFEHANELYQELKELSERQLVRSSLIVRQVAEEATAKFLILLDAVRCPRNKNGNNELFSRHLQSFNDHLAKGIYFEYI